jgi:hypothetical protein
MLLISCHLNHSEPSKEVMNLHWLLEAAELANWGVLEQVAVVVLGEWRVAVPAALPMRGNIDLLCPAECTIVSVQFIPCCCRRLQPGAAQRLVHL